MTAGNWASQLFLVVRRNALLRWRRPGLLVLELIWPALAYSLLIVLRHVTLPNGDTVCNKPALPLPSAGTLPFIQSLVCSIGAQCVNSSDPDLLFGDDARLYPIYNQLEPLVADDATRPALRDLPYTFQLVQSLRTALRDPAIVELLSNGITVSEYITDADALKHYLVDELHVLPSTTFDYLLNSTINVTNWIEQNSSWTHRDLVCNADALAKVVNLPADASAANVSRHLCAINATVARVTLRRLQTAVDVAKLVEMAATATRALGDARTTAALGDVAAMARTVQRLRGLAAPSQREALLGSLATHWPRLWRLLVFAEYSDDNLDVLRDLVADLRGAFGGDGDLQRPVWHAASQLVDVAQQLLASRRPPTPPTGGPFSALFNGDPADLTLGQVQSNLSLFLQSLDQNTVEEISSMRTWQDLQTSLCELRLFEGKECQPTANSSFWIQLFQAVNQTSVSQIDWQDKRGQYSLPSNVTNLALGLTRLGALLQLQNNSSNNSFSHRLLHFLDTVQLEPLWQSYSQRSRSKRWLNASSTNEKRLYHTSLVVTQAIEVVAGDSAKWAQLKQQICQHTAVVEEMRLSVQTFRKTRMSFGGVFAEGQLGDSGLRWFISRLLHLRSHSTSTELLRRLSHTNQNLSTDELHSKLCANDFAQLFHMDSDVAAGALAELHSALCHMNLSMLLGEVSESIHLQTFATAQTARCDSNDGFLFRWYQSTQLLIQEIDSLTKALDVPLWPVNLVRHENIGVLEGHMTPSTTFLIDMAHNSSQLRSVSTALPSLLHSTQIFIDSLLCTISTIESIATLLSQPAQMASLVHASDFLGSWRYNTNGTCCDIPCQWRQPEFNSSRFQLNTILVHRFNGVNQLCVKTEVETQLKNYNSPAFASSVALHIQIKVALQNILQITDMLKSFAERIETWHQLPFNGPFAAAAEQPVTYFGNVAALVVRLSGILVNDSWILQSEPLKYIMQSVQQLLVDFTLTATLSENNAMSLSMLLPSAPTWRILLKQMSSFPTNLQRSMLNIVLQPHRFLFVASSTGKWHCDKLKLHSNLGVSSDEVLTEARINRLVQFICANADDLATELTGLFESREYNSSIFAIALSQMALRIENGIVAPNLWPDVSHKNGGNIGGMHNLPRIVHPYQFDFKGLQSNLMEILPNCSHKDGSTNVSNVICSKFQQLMDMIQSMIENDLSGSTFADVWLPEILPLSYQLLHHYTQNQDSLNQNKYISILLQQMNLTYGLHQQLNGTALSFDELWLNSILQHLPQNVLKQLNYCVNFFENSFQHNNNLHGSIRVLFPDTPTMRTMLLQVPPMAELKEACLWIGNNLSIAKFVKDDGIQHISCNPATSLLPALPVRLRGMWHDMEQLICFIITNLASVQAEIMADDDREQAAWKQPDELLGSRLLAVYHKLLTTFHNSSNGYRLPTPVQWMNNEHIQYIDEMNKYTIATISRFGLVTDSINNWSIDNHFPSELASLLEQLNTEVERLLIQMVGAVLYNGNLDVETVASLWRVPLSDWLIHTLQMPKLIVGEIMEAKVTNLSLLIQALSSQRQFDLIICQRLPEDGIREIISLAPAVNSSLWSESLCNFSQTLGGSEAARVRVLKILNNSLLESTSFFALNKTGALTNNIFSLLRQLVLGNTTDSELILEQIGHQFDYALSMLSIADLQQLQQSFWIFTEIADSDQVAVILNSTLWNTAKPYYAAITVFVNQLQSLNENATLHSQAWMSQNGSLVYQTITEQQLEMVSKLLENMTLEHMHDEYWNISAWMSFTHKNISSLTASTLDDLYTALQWSSSIINCSTCSVRNEEFITTVQAYKTLIHELSNQFHQQNSTTPSLQKILSSHRQLASILKAIMMEFGLSNNTIAHLLLSNTTLDAMFEGISELKLGCSRSLSNKSQSDRLQSITDRNHFIELLCIRKLRRQFVGRIMGLHYLNASVKSKPKHFYRGMFPDIFRYLTFFSSKYFTIHIGHTIKGVFSDGQTITDLVDAANNVLKLLSAMSLDFEAVLTNNTLLMEMISRFTTIITGPRVRHTELMDQVNILQARYGNLSGGLSWETLFGRIQMHLPLLTDEQRENISANLQHVARTYMMKQPPADEESDDSQLFSALLDVANSLQELPSISLEHTLSLNNNTKLDSYWLHSDQLLTMLEDKSDLWVNWQNSDWLQLTRFATNCEYVIERINEDQAVRFLFQQTMVAKFLAKQLNNIERYEDTLCQTQPMTARGMYDRLVYEFGWMRFIRRFNRQPPTKSTPNCKQLATAITRLHESAKFATDHLKDGRLLTCVRSAMAKYTSGIDEMLRLISDLLYVSTNAEATRMLVRYSPANGAAQTNGSGAGWAPLADAGAAFFADAARMSERWPSDESAWLTFLRAVYSDQLDSFLQRTTVFARDSTDILRNGTASRDFGTILKGVSAMKVLKTRAEQLLDASQELNAERTSDLAYEFGLSDSAIRQLKIAPGKIIRHLNSKSSTCTVGEVEGWFEGPVAAVRTVATQLCDMSSERRERVARVLLGDVGAPSLLRKYVAEQLAALLELKGLPPARAQRVVAAADRLPSLIRSLRFSQSQLTQTSDTPTENGTLPSAGRFLCGRQVKTLLEHLSLVPSDSETRATTTRQLSAFDRAQMDDLPASCHEMYRNLTNSELGLFIWSHMRPLLRSKIAVIPDTGLTRQLISRANKTFAQMAQWVEWLDNSAAFLRTVGNASHFQEQLNEFEESMRHPLIRSVVWSSVRLDTEQLMAEMAQTGRIDPSALGALLHLAQQFFAYAECVNLDRFRFFTSSASLAKHGFDPADYLAVVTFDMHSGTGKLEYTIRMSSESVPRTDELIDRLWNPLQRSEKLVGMGGYLRGFVQLQDMIDSAIVDTFGGSSGVPNYIRQLPRPCSEHDVFAEYVKYWLPIFSAVAWSLTVGLLAHTYMLEADLRLTEVLRVSGLRRGVRVAAWLLVSLAVVVCSAAIVIALLRFGNVLPFSDVSLLLALFIAFGLSVIAFSAMVSSCLERSAAAAFASVVLFAMANLPFLILSMSTPRIPFTRSYPVWLLAASCVAAPSAFGWAVTHVGAWEQQAVGAQWHNAARDPWGADTELNVAFTIAALLFDAVLYALTAFAISRLKHRIPSLTHLINRFKRVAAKEAEDAVGLEKRDDCCLVESDCGGEAVLVARNLTLRYDGSTGIAVDNVSISLYDRQITSLLGQNAAGKTSTISMLAGLRQPTSGTVDFLTGRNMGVCQQHNSLFHTLTTREHIEFFGELKGLSGTELAEDVDRLLRDAGLTAVAARRAGELSGGMQRRLCVAVAFAGAARLVLLDEPTAGVDPVARHAIWSLVRANARRCAVLISTHHLDEAAALSHRVAIFHQGRLRCFGSVQFLGAQLALRESNGLLDASSKQSPLALDQIYMQISELDGRAEVDSYDGSTSDLFGPNMHTHTNVDYSMTGTPFTYADELDDDDDEETALEPSTLSQSHALFMKKFYHFTRNWHFYIGSLILPFIFLLATMGFSLTIVSKQAVSQLPLTYGMYSHTDHVFFSGDKHLFATFAKHNYCDSYVSSEDEMAFNGTLRDCSCERGKQVCPVGAEGVVAPRTCTHVDGNFIYNATQAQHRFGLTNYLTRTYQQFAERRFGGWSVDSLGYNKSRRMVTWYDPRGLHSVAAFLNQATNLKLAGTGVTVLTNNHPFTEDQSSTDELFMQKIADIAISMCILSAYTTVCIVLVLQITQERLRKERCLQRLCGVSPVVYWCTAFCFDYMVYLAMTIGGCLIILACQLPVYSNGVFWWTTALLIALHGAAVLPQMYICQQLFNDATTAGLVSFAGALFVGAVTMTLVGFFAVFHWLFSDVYAVAKVAFLVFPQYCLTGGILETSRLHLRASLFQSFGEAARQTSPLSLHIAGKHCIALLFHSALLLALRILIDVVADAGSAASKAAPTADGAQSDDVRDEDARARTDHHSFALRVVGLRKAYKSACGTNHAVGGVSFGVRRGECFGLLGVNGAGKTTTFEILTSAMRPTAGEAFVNGTSVLTREGRRSIGYCPQTSSCDPTLSPRQTLSVYCRLKGVAAGATERWLRRLQLTAHADTPVRACSGGTQRKVCVAVALMGGPPVALLDEPTAGVDAGTRQLIWRLVERSLRLGRSVLLTSHRTAECEAVCARVAIMVNGRLRCVGAPDHLASRYGGARTLQIRASGDARQRRILATLKSRHIPTQSVRSAGNLMELRLTDEQVNEALAALRNVVDGQSMHIADNKQMTLDIVFANFAREQTDGWKIDGDTD